MKFLSHHGVLGLNARSLLYIKPFNPKKATAMADSKLKTKAYLAARGIPVAKLFGRIETREQLREFDFSTLPDECVLKPNQGFGGEGILILRGRNKNGRFLQNGKRPIKESDLREHIEDILDGKFSLKGIPDTAFFEQILRPHDCFSRFLPAGLPDIRVIVFNLVPVMAMVRIPTGASDGKANIHAGGIGIGVDIAKGVTTHAAQYNHVIKQLPHGGSPAGHKIPYWDQILLICSQIQQITNIGYLAVDITIDEQMGPALLEVNARAGLTVQLANLAPLRARLERVKGLKVDSPEKGVRIGQDLFGSKTRKEKSTTEEKITLGVHEPLQITLGDGSLLEVTAVIASTKDRSIFSEDLIKELLEKNGAEFDAENKVYRVKYTLRGKKIQTTVEKASMKERAIIGSRDLAGFLIDPTKKPEETRKDTITKKVDLRAIDKVFAQIDRDLLILKHIKPLNLKEELESLHSDVLHNPTFTYAQLDTDLDDAEKRLQESLKGTTPLGILLEKKRKELLKRIALLRARGNNERFTLHSIELFGKPTRELLDMAQEELDARIACDLPPPKKKLISAEKALQKFEEVLQRYALHNWRVKITKRLIADVTVGANTVYIRAGAIFTPEHIASLIAHEIETHVLTSENGDHQPYELLRRGCAGYLDTQEGLAIHNQNGVLSQYADKRFSPQRNLLALSYSLHHSLAETRKYLIEELDLPEGKALMQSIMMKRGMRDTSEPGGFTKSLTYYRGLKTVEKFLKDGNDMRRLYVGKVAIEDLHIIEALPDLEPPLILPQFLREEQHR